jgi:hypothetical protein
MRDTLVYNNPLSMPAYWIGPPSGLIARSRKLITLCCFILWMDGWMDGLLTKYNYSYM